jgi:hypothetical protein
MINGVEFSVDEREALECGVEPPHSKGCRRY